ncbi:MAG: hypothetical protein M5T61_16410 [Acidimicrobiia bacterium]|nr:hypothetical protein [Acidimicrobiia bacterium]
MFAIRGSWPVDGELDEEQLAHIADTVSSQPGFVSGFWGQDIGDGAAAQAFVVFADEASASAMADGVRSAIPGADVAVERILAHA